MDFFKKHEISRHTTPFNERDFNSRYPTYNDDSDYTTNAPSYYDDLARKNALLKTLSLRIWEYQEVINKQFNEWDDELKKRFLAWDKNLEEFDDEVLKLLQKWLLDGTLDHIINDTIFSWKADKTEVNEIHINVKTHFNIKGDGVTDDTLEIQKALNSAKDYGTKFYFPPGEYIISQPIIFPVMSYDSNTLKRIEIYGANGVTINAPRGGLTNFIYTGTEGNMFDLKGGDNLPLKGTIKFKDFSATGQNNDLINNDIRGIVGHELVSSQFINISLRRFRVNLEITGMYYYTVFDTCKFYYANSSNVITRDDNNGARFYRCSFGVSGADSIHLYDPAVLTSFESCYFEGNMEGYAIRVTNGLQVNITDCYFERNKAVLLFSTAPTYETGIIYLSNNYINHTSLSDDRMINLLSSATIHLNANTVLWLSETVLPMIYSVEDNVNVIDVNTFFLDKEPINFYSPKINLIQKISDENVFINTVLKGDVTIEEDVNLNSNINYNSNNGRTFVNGGNVSSRTSLEFPEVTDSPIQITSLRNTTTTGTATVDYYKPDGLGSRSVTFDLQKGQGYFKGGIGTDNIVNESVISETPTRKMEIFDAYGRSRGFIPVYEE